ncbi:MAG: hypothetical protein JKX68_09795 [Flavobacteriales bacterium]|nr:hypothetical protein [Flavobacteriales bacterium]
MKKITLPILFLLAFLLHGQQNFAQTPVEHMDECTASFSNVKRDTWKYLKAVTQGKKARKIEKTRMGLLNQYKEEKKKVLKLKSSSLRDAVVKYLDMSYTVIKEDFDKILDMEDIAEQSYDLMEAYILAKQKAGDKLDEAFADYQFAEKDYAISNNITLIEGDGQKDKVSKKIDKASDALVYYNKIFLIYFKPNKQEAYALDALNRGDISSVEQNANSLGGFSDEGFPKLKEVGNYKGYSGLKIVANKFLTFYKAEAEADFPAIVDFYLKKETFEKAQKNLNSKSKKSRTQKDVDEYNAASDEYNKAVNIYNEKINAMNSKRTQLFNEWNKTIDHFFKTYSK